jgi:predicted NBD/HSP70 family sugar kinase
MVASTPSPSPRRTLQAGTRSSGVRRHNLAALLERLHVHGSASRSELGTGLGLNRSTIGDLVQELEDHGLVLEQGVATQSGPGRPSPMVHVRPDAAVALAVELGVESVSVATIGLGGHVLDEERTGLPRRASSPDDVVRRVVEVSARLTRDVPPQRLAGVGAAVPGLTRRSDGFVHLAPNLRWKGVPFGALLAAGLDLPPRRVHVANEADLGALGEHRRGAGRGFDNLVFVSGEVGIGAGLVIGGRPMLGASGYAGEAGHMLVNPRGRRCTCGARGCWETEAGEPALVRALGAPADEDVDVVATVLERLEAQDAAALRAVAGVGRWLGLGIGNLVNLLNPEVVVLGGMFQVLHPWLRDTLQTAVRGQSLDEVLGQLEVVASTLATSAQLHGAAELGLAEVLNDPTSVSP